LPCPDNCFDDPKGHGFPAFGAVLISAVVLPTLILIGMPSAGCLEGGRIGILYIGDIARSAPFREMVSDPLFSITFVSASLRGFGGWDISDVRRAVRMYMPRTYSDLRDYDVIVLSNANRFAVGPHNIELLANGVGEAGTGLLMSGGWESFGGGFGNPSWGDTSIGRFLPTEDVVDTWVQYPRGYLFLVIDRKDHELMRSVIWHGQSLGVQNMWNDFHHNLVRAKPGTEVLAHVRNMGFDDHPAMVTWEVENRTRTFALTGEIHTFSRPGIWDYSLDFGSNLMIYLDGRPVPQDVELVHRVRQMMTEVRTRKSVLLGLLDFCESAGANTGKVMRRIDQVDGMISATMPEYLDLHFGAMLEAYRQADQMLGGIEEEAIKLKNRALLWVYIVEWLGVTGTLMICGLVLWSLMIRRRLYAPVGITRII